MPLKKNWLEQRDTDGDLYKDRSKVERYFNKLNRTDFYDLNKGERKVFVIISVLSNAGKNP